MKTHHPNLYEHKKYVEAILVLYLQFQVLILHLFYANYLQYFAKFDLLSQKIVNLPLALDELSDKN